MDHRRTNFSPRLTVSLVDAPGDLSYPIAGYSYLIIYLNSSMACKSAVAFYRYVQWLSSDPLAKSDCIRLGFVPICQAVRDIVLTHMAKHFKCNGNVLVRALVDLQIAQENKPDESWRTIVLAGALTEGFVVIALISYIIAIQMKQNAALLQKKWKTDISQMVELKSKLLQKSLWSLATSDEKSQSSAHSLGVFATSAKVMQLDGHYVWLQSSTNPDKLKTSTQRTLLWAEELQHINVSRCYGVTTSAGTMHYVLEFNSNGLLHDITQNDKFSIDNNFKFCISLDVALGMNFLHNKGIISGNLTSSTCIIDGKWNVKVADWIYSKVADKERSPTLLQRPWLIPQDMEADPDFMARQHF